VLLNLLLFEPSDYKIQMITLTNQVHWVAKCKSVFVNIWKIDKFNQMKTLTVTTLSRFHLVFHYVTVVPQNNFFLPFSDFLPSRKSCSPRGEARRHRDPPHQEVARLLQGIAQEEDLRKEEGSKVISSEK
jgi:hypothetical protein